MGKNNLIKIISIISIILIWLDVLFTSIFIRKFGIDIEANIIGRILFQYPIILVFVKIISSLLVVWLSKLNYKLAKMGLLAIFIIYLFLIVYHIILTINVIKILK